VEKHTTVAVDVAKSVFEIAVSKEPGKICGRRRLSRGQLTGYFATLPPSTVVLEACGSAHHWGRVFEGQGHRVVLLPPAQVSRYRLREKTDRADAAALLEASRNQEIVAVPVKTLHQQAICSVHRLRSGWMATRTARLNALRGILREVGVTVAVGARNVLPRLTKLMAEGVLEPWLEPLLSSAAAEIRELERNIAAADQELKELSKTLPGARELLSIPGIGTLTATALIASIGQPTRFHSARRLAAFVGLVPREHSSGNRRFLGSISKRGDPYLRTLLTHGARSVLLAARRKKRQDRLESWALKLQQRRGHNRATIALANKLARLAWAVWSRQVTYAATPAEETV
jgi:transposase